MKKKILLVLGHPDTASLCGALAGAYGEGARAAGSEVRELQPGDMKFDPVLWHGYNRPQELEADLVRARELVLWADHLVFVYPNWWGTMPARLKGFFDRVFLPGFAFRYRAGSAFWDRLLSGRTAHLIVTMDTPPWYYRWIYRRPGHNAMKRATLGFCGIRVTKITELSVVRNATSAKRARWIEKVKGLGYSQ